VEVLPVGASDDWGLPEAIRPEPTRSVWRSPALLAAVIPATIAAISAVVVAVIQTGGGDEPVPPPSSATAGVAAGPSAGAPGPSGGGPTGAGPSLSGSPTGPSGSGSGPSGNPGPADPGPGTKASVKLTPNQPGGYDLDTLRPILDEGDDRGDLLLTDSLLYVDLAPQNDAVMLAPGDKEADYRGCTSPEGLRDTIRFSGFGEHKEFPVGSTFCLRTNGGKLASLTLERMHDADDQNGRWMLLSARLWPAPADATE
jgi:hypothetical protein